MTLPERLLKAAEAAEQAADAFEEIGDDQTVADWRVAKLNKLAAEENLERELSHHTVKNLARIAVAAEAHVAKLEPFKVNAEAFYAEELAALRQLLEDLNRA